MLLGTAVEAFPRGESAVGAPVTFNRTSFALFDVRVDGHVC